MIEDDTEKCTVGTKRWVTMGQKEQFYDKSTQGRIQKFNLGRESSGWKPRGEGHRRIPPPQWGVWKGDYKCCVKGEMAMGKRGVPLSTDYGVWEASWATQRDSRREPGCKRISFLNATECLSLRCFQAYAAACVGRYLLNLEEETPVRPPLNTPLNLYSFRSPGPGVVSSCMRVIFCLFTQKKNVESPSITYCTHAAVTSHQRGLALAVQFGVL